MICITYLKKFFRYCIVNGLLMDSRGECTTLFHAIVDVITVRNFNSLLVRLCDINPGPAALVNYLCLYRYFIQSVTTDSAVRSTD